MLPEIKMIRESAIPLTPKEIMEALPHRATAIPMSLKRALKDGLVRQTERGKYFHPSRDIEPCSIRLHGYSVLVQMLNAVVNYSDIGRDTVYEILDILIEELRIDPKSIADIREAWKIKEGAYWSVLSNANLAERYERWWNSYGAKVLDPNWTEDDDW